MSTTDTATEETTLNEFEYSPEEQAELAKLEELNGNSDELKAADPADDTIQPGEDDPDLKLDDDFIDDLLKPGEEGAAPSPDPENDPPAEPDPKQEQEQENDPGLDYPDYEERLNESKQQLDQATGEVDDTLDKLRELAEKYDEGEISQGKYDIEKMQLERTLKRQEKAVDQLESQHMDLSAEAKTKVDEYHEVKSTAWQRDIQTFLNDPANALLATNQHVAQQFDNLLASMGNSGVFEGLNNHQILQSVRNQLAFRIPELAATQAQQQQPKPAAKKPAKPTHSTSNIPPSMSQMQAQEMPADDPFAYLRKLSGVQYEEAISKLTEEQQEKFFFG